MMMDSDAESLIERALRAMLLTRDYIGEKALPASPGWTWYEASKELADALPNSHWSRQFKTKVENNRRSAPLSGIDAPALQPMPRWASKMTLTEAEERKYLRPDQQM